MGILHSSPLYELLSIPIILQLPRRVVATRGKLSRRRQALNIYISTWQACTQLYLCSCPYNTPLSIPPSYSLSLSPTPILSILCMVKFSQASEAEAAQWLRVRLISVALNYIFFCFLLLCGNHISVSAYCTSVRKHCATNFGLFFFWNSPLTISNISSVFQIGSNT